MTHITAVHTDCFDTREAAEDLARQINAGLPGAADAIVLFASSRFDYAILLETLTALCRPGLLVGSSSAGEFTHAQQGTGTASALAFQSPDLVVAAALGEGISLDSRAAARDIVARFQGLQGTRYAYRAALVMTDALAGHAEDFVEEMTVATSGRYLLAGGGAGDDANFTRTHVFLGTRTYTDAAVALEILSDKPLGVGVGHGWQAARVRRGVHGRRDRGAVPGRQRQRRQRPGDVRDPALAGARLAFPVRPARRHWRVGGRARRDPAVGVADEGAR